MKCLKPYTNTAPLANGTHFEQKFEIWTETAKNEPTPILKPFLDRKNTYACIWCLKRRHHITGYGKIAKADEMCALAHHKQAPVRPGCGKNPYRQMLRRRWFDTKKDLTELTQLEQTIW